MVKIAQIEIQALLHLYHNWKEQGDIQNSIRLRDVIQKYEKKECMLAFCGHFSAGKSTMMNALYGQDVLPTSPIPTSANVVKIRRGDNRVLVTLQSGERHAYEGSYTDTQLKALCKNGDEVVAIEITREDAPLPDGVILVDTPGIDSTDDAHRIATESALHIADVIFYMMDYNHVQSEVNLQFVKELKERQKRVYLIINQIDKHKEDELTFTAYRDSVAASFANWNIAVDGVFYTSLRNRQHPHNEIATLETLLTTIMQERQRYLVDSVVKETVYLLQEHEQFMMKQEDGAVSYDAMQLQTLYAQEKQLVDTMHTKKTVFLKGLQHILDNAYLMPFETRSLAEAYLETELTNFKVGLFFAKGKTEKVKAERLLAFYQQLQEAVRTQLDFHVKEYVLTFLKEEQLYTEEIGRRVYEMGAVFEPTLLTSLIKRGAGFTGDYVLHYTNDVADAVKKQVRTQVTLMMEEQFSRLMEGIEQELIHLQQEIVRCETTKEKHASYEMRLAQRQAYIQELHDVWQGIVVPPQRELVEIQEEPTYTSAALLFEEEVYEEVVDVTPIQTGSGVRIEEALSYVKQAEQQLENMPALRHLYEEIKEKRARVENRQFTVALFGAFSAGKSSFANALLGAKVLPVSPNPTTAAINKIAPVTKDRPHGTVLVQVKTAETLLLDLQLVYKLFEKNVATIEEAIAGIPALLLHPAPNGRQKTSLSFLQAVQTGYPVFAERLGKLIETDMTEFEGYVANEAQSCFVSYLELYYDCAFTRQGITLVDTPGADSIHARHTDVAFTYIKNADAILFVTYYNHVFSRADREFLIQLGRVKDSFALDKMFFLINAADLAASEEELQLVKGYIADQLLQYGIRQPRLFALSSLFALDEKIGKERQYGILSSSGMQPFEEAFTTFIRRDLLLVSIVALQANIEAADQMLQTIVTNARAGKEEKEAMRNRYEQQQRAMRDIVSNYNVLTEEAALAQEIQDLLYYVKQRVFFRYNDVFPEIFNPAVLQNNSEVKQRLRECVMEMIDFLQHDFVQEMRATSLRIEKWMNAKRTFSQEQVQKECLSINKEIAFLDSTYAYEVVAYEEPFQSLEIQQFKKAMSYFKNAKNFFEKNDKVLLQEEMKTVLEPEATIYMQQQEQLLQTHYKRVWSEAWEMMKQQMQTDITEHFTGLIDALTTEFDIHSYEAAQVEVSKIRKAVEEAMQAS